MSLEHLKSDDICVASSPNRVRTAGAHFYPSTNGGTTRNANKRRRLADILAWVISWRLGGNDVVIGEGIGRSTPHELC